MTSATTGLGRARPDFVPFARQDLETSIPARFARQVERAPDRLAVRTPRHSFTYRALDRASNGVAAALRDVLGDAERPVALLFEQGAPLVAAILGVLKAGKLYLALEPGDPAARIDFMLRDSGAALILTDAAHRELASGRALRERPVLELDRLEPCDSFELPPSVGPERLAYLFYTSGSTGEPKGVYDDHRNVMHNVLRYTNSLQIAPDDRLTLLQSCTFSGSVSSLFCALLNGAAVFPVDLRREGVERAVRWLTQEQVTIYHSVPALFQQIMGSARRLPSLRVIRLEGDQASMRHVRLYQERFGPECVLVNGLGATETGITRQFFIHPGTRLPGDVVPVGYATEDMEVLLLDEFGVEVPGGAPGEIAVRSRYLARGYWKNRKLTQEAFRVCPRDSTRRIYRSGDSGRMRPDGCLEYLGRTDFQVKIRGARVSIPAIEAALSATPGIREAVVMARSDARDLRLTGYVVPSVAPPPSVGAIRRALAERLHRPMIPSAYVVLDALPLDSNGKVDRRALPPAADARPALDVPYAAPRSDTERRLSEIWREVLGLAEVGIHDDFFELGGDSFHAMELLVLVERRLGVSLPHSVFLETHSVAEMARAIDDDRRASCLVPLRPTGRLSPFFCVHAHVGQVLDYASLARRMDPERPFYALQAQGLDGRDELLTTIEEMATQYVREIRRVEPEGPYLLGGYCFGTLVALEMAQQLVADGRSVDLIALIDPDPVAAPGSRLTQPREAPRARAARHLRRVAALGFGESLSYASLRLWYVLRSLPGQLRPRLLSALWPLVGFRRRLLPRSLWSSGFLALHTRAAARYRPRPCSARGVLLYADAAEPVGDGADGGWAQLFSGGLALRHIPCGRHEILIEPNVRLLARELDAALATRAGEGPSGMEPR